MKIAALILAHHRPDLLRRLTARLATPLWRAFIHLDARSDISVFMDLPGDVAFLAERRRVYWAGFNMVQATLDLMRVALTDPDVTHLYLMSGQDYLLRTDAGIKRHMGGGGGNFIDLLPMPQSHKPLTRLTKFHMNDLASRRIAVWLGRLAGVLPARDVEHLLHGWQPYGGTQWWCLNRAVVMEILSFIAKNAWYSEAFRWSHCPDEMFFHTLFAGLGFSADGDCPTITFWPEGHGNPLVIDAALYAEAVDDWHLAARKFDSWYPA